MATNERAIKGEKNKKTTDDVIPGKEKAKDRREESLPKRSAPGTADGKSNQDEPKAEKKSRAENDNKD